MPAEIQGLGRLARDETERRQVAERVAADRRGRRRPRAAPAGPAAIRHAWAATRATKPRISAKPRGDASPHDVPSPGDTGACTCCRDGIEQLTLDLPDKEGDAGDREENVDAAVRRLIASA